MLNPEVLNYLIEWKTVCHIDTLAVRTKYVEDKCILSIFTNRPGVMIGKAGCTVAKYKALICDKKHRWFDDLELIEVSEFINLSEKVDVDAYYNKYFNYVGDCY